MKGMKKVIALLLIATLVFTFAACGGQNGGGGEEENTEPEFTFTFACEDAATAASTEVWNAFIDRVSELSEGRIKIEPYYGGVLGSSGEQLNMCEEGAVDLTHVGIGHYAGRFPCTEVFTIPGLKYESAWQVGKALEYLYSNSKLGYISDEIKNVKVLGFRSNNRCPLSHVGAPWESADDIKGTLINSSNGPTNAMSEALGMNIVSIGFPDRYEGIQKGTIQACTSDYLALESFSMYDVIDSVCDVSIACQMGYLVMNWDSFNSLPEDLQEVMIEAAKPMVDEFYKVFKGVENRAYDLAAEKNVTIYTPNDEVMATIQNAMELGQKTWIEERTAGGYDAQGLIDEVQAALDMFAGQAPEV